MLFGAVFKPRYAKHYDTQTSKGIKSKGNLKSIISIYSLSYVFFHKPDLDESESVK